MNDLKTITEDLEKLNKEIVTAEKELTQAEAKQELLLKQGEKYGVKSAEEAEKLIEENAQKLNVLQAEIEEGYKKLKEMYEW